MKRIVLILMFVALGCPCLRAGLLADSVRVHFRVNRTEIDSLLMGNDAAMRDFAARMKNLRDLNDLKDVKGYGDTVTINSILITGAASPEGSVALNERLSRGRADAITRWLKGYFGFPDSVARFLFKGRDWPGLLRLVENDPAVPYRREVMDLLCDIVKCPPPASYKDNGVTRLKALRGGEPYRYLLRRHFPELRASEVFIEAEIRPLRIPDLKDPKDFKGLKYIKLIVPDTVASIGMPVAGTSGGYVFALKSNLLCDALATPSIGVEFPIGRHFSLGADWMYAWWKNRDRNRHWRVYGGDISARWYFGGGRTSRASLQGHHVGLYGQALLFQLAFGGKGYISGIPGQDILGKPWLGGGVEYGYSMRVGKRLNIDFSLGLGYIGGEYRVYRPIDGHYVWQSTHRRNWFGPTKAEISLVWLIGKMPKVGTRPAASASNVGTQRAVSAPKVGTHGAASASNVGTQRAASAGKEVAE